MYNSIIYGAIILSLIIAALLFGILIRREYKMKNFYFSVRTKRAAFYVSIEAKNYDSARRIVGTRFENSLISPVQGVAFMQLAYNGKAYCYTYNPNSDTFTII